MVGGDDAAQFDDPACWAGLDGVAGEVFEDEQDEVGFAVWDGGWLFGGMEAKLDLSLPGLGLDPVFEELKDLVGIELILAGAAFLTEDSHHLVDEILHSAGSGGSLCPGFGAVVPRVWVCRCEALEPEEGVFESVNQMGGDGTDG